MKKTIIGLCLFTFMLNANELVTMKTSLGDIKLEIFSSNPQLSKTTTNFKNLVLARYYEGTKFHRVIKNFMIQGGDPTATGAGGMSSYGKKFEDEIVKEIVFDVQGMLAMANSGPNTNGSQFFITTKPSPWLNGKHTIFGKVVEGMDVISKIENVQVDENDKPKENVKILSTRIEYIDIPESEKIKVKPTEIKEKTNMAREF